MHCRQANILCRAARAAGLLAMAGVPLTEVVMELTPGWHLPYVFPFNFFFAAFGGMIWLVFPGFIVMVPSLIAWRRHLLGGVLLMLSSSLLLAIVVVFPFDGDERTRMVFRMLFHPRYGPALAVFLLAGLLHLACWWKEKQGPAAGSWKT